MAQRSFKLTDELDARLEVAAKADGRSVSSVIVRTLETYMQAYEQAIGIAENLRETPRGEIVAADPSKPVRYEAKRQPVEGTPLPKIAPRGWAK